MKTKPYKLDGMYLEDAISFLEKEKVNYTILYSEYIDHLFCKKFDYHFASDTGEFIKELRYER